MPISKLATVNIMSPNHDSGRGGKKVCKFTPHHMAGNLTVEQCGQVFKPTSRQASSNYGIGTDGRIACYVDESNRAWTSSSQSNDQQAVTVEVANSSYGGNWPVSDKAWKSLVDLATDVCRRYSFKLNYTGTPSGSLTEHQMFASTNCPGPYLHSRMNQLVLEVNRNLSTGNYPTTGVNDGTTTGQIIDTATAYAAAVAANILPSEEEIDPYMITIDQNTSDLNFDNLRNLGVIGVCIDIGCYFDANHNVRSVFRQPKLDKQVNACIENGMPFALYTTTRAKSVEEAMLELQQIRLSTLAYPPSLGFWLKLGFNNSKATNNKIVDAYYEYMVDLGFKDQLGFYVTTEQLKRITWSKYYDNWYLWLDKHVTKLSEIPSLLTPDFFMCRGIS